jgi:diguanylate cyclase (GGDEF)-like protein/PAS domain S-box-containing protein
MNGTLARRITAGIVATGLGLGLGLGFATVIQRHNHRATQRWQSASLAHDAIIEIESLEAIRAELVSATDFNRDELIQQWTLHQAEVEKLLTNRSMKDLDPNAVANAERLMSIYSAAAGEQVAYIRFQPEFAEKISRERVLPSFIELQRALKELRVGLDQLGPNAQRNVDRDLWILLPTMATLLTLVCALAIGSRRRAAVKAAEGRRDAKFRALVQGASDVLTVVEADGTLSELTESSATLFGRPASELTNTTMASLVIQDDRAALQEVWQSVVATGRSRTVTVRVAHADGRCRIVELTGSRAPELEGTAWVWHDVSAQTELAEQLRKQSFQDDLTGLANRALLRDRTTMALAEPSSVSMLLVDIDRFQNINDAFGHAIGDDVLRATAGRMRACVRPGDTVARLGGDEFAALVSGADARALDAVVERMLDSCRQPLMINGQEIRPTISIGIASGNRDGSVEDLLRRADTALAIAKTNGRDRSQVHVEEMDQRARQRVSLANELHHVVERDQLLAVYQPLVSLKDGTVSGFESLLRWRHPEHGMISPLDFIPLAEENNTIIAIGRWILNEAVDQAAKLPAPMRMNVNLSARQLVDASLVGDVESALARSGLEPHRLVLEITESLLLDDGDTTLNVLNRLREIGCLLAIDDFGTGYSSLGYLKRLPVNIVKLDKSFLDARLATSDGERAFLESILHVGRTLNLETVAEGIEDIATSETLRSIGCDKGQGFLFSKPVEADRVGEVAATRYETGITTHA